MNPLKTLLSPFTDITRAVVLPFKALFVVGLTGTINAMTYHGVWWFKWVALGMGIAVLVAFAKALRTVLLLALVAWVGTKIYKRYGEAARGQFDAWVAKAQPQAAQVLAALHMPQAGATASTSAAAGSAVGGSV
jgi:hypothetical protein